MNLVNNNMKVLHGNTYAKSDKYLKYRDEWHRRAIEKDPGDFPLFLDLDVSTACNFSCPSCSYTINKSEKHFMDIELYKSIIDEASANGCYGIKFHTICRGEPLLNPNVVDMVRYAKNKGLIDVRMNTNGHLLTTPIIKQLVYAGLDLLIFSIDGSSPTEYLKSGRNGDFHKLESAVWFARSYSNIGLRKRMVVRVQAIDFPWLNKEKFSIHWAKWADEVTVIDYQNMHKRIYGLSTDKWYCPMLFQRMSILWDGTMLPCNMDDRQLNILGTVGIDPIKEVWKDGFMINHMRKLNIDYMGEYEVLCDGCYFRTNEINKLEG